jgi:hypothetical protein
MLNTQIKLSIELNGRYCNHWPFARISINDQILFDQEIQDSVVLNFTITAIEKNHLIIEHYGKQFGDNNVYDCTADQSQDCVLTIKDIQFEDITIGSEIMNKLFFNTVWTNAQLQTIDSDLLLQMSKISCHNGAMNFNSIFDLEFETPIFNWLTIAKYKQPIDSLAYFSNHTLRWHYTEDLQLLEEIKRLINQ